MNGFNSIFGQILQLFSKREFFESDLGLPTKLSEINIPEAGLVQLSKDALADGGHFNNPVACSEETLFEMYKQAY